MLGLTDDKFTGTIAPMDKTETDNDRIDPEHPAEQHPLPQRFRVTQAIYSYRRYIVTAVTWEEATHKMQEAAPPDGEVAHFEETDHVKSIPDVVHDGAAFFHEVAFVDSEDQTETYYERP